MKGAKLAVPKPTVAERRDGLFKATERLTPNQKQAAFLYSRGYDRKAINALLWQTISPPVDRHPRKYHRTSSRRQLILWEQDQNFRDAIWELALTDTDLNLPSILGGLVKHARRGKVDAAKLVLELVGRWSPRPEEVQATQVNIVFDGIPRPERHRQQSIEAEEIRGEVLEEEDVEDADVG